MSELKYQWRGWSNRMVKAMMVISIHKSRPKTTQWLSGWYAYFDRSIPMVVYPLVEKARNHGYLAIHTKTRKGESILKPTDRRLTATAYQPNKDNECA